jgi:hypothetical protein
MKKTILVIWLILVSLACWSVDIFRGTDATPTWDAVILMTDGTPISPADTVAYEIYISPVADYLNPSVPFPQDPAQHTLLAEVFTLFYNVIIPQDGQIYAIAVRTVLYIDGGPIIEYSSLNWSYENGVFTPNPFLYQGLLSPKPPEGLNRE